MELTNKNIGAVIEEIRAFFESSKVPRKDVLKICLVVEESLLRYQEKFGEAHEFNLYKKKWFSEPKIIIRIKGEPFYPLHNEQEDDDTILSNAVMQRLLHFDEAKTTYRYENGYNELISYSTQERKPIKIPGGSITIAIVLAIAFSFVIGHLSPEVQNILSEKIISPALSTLTALIVTVTVFMIFFSIVAGICAIEDVTMLSNIGSTVVGRFFLIDVLIVAVTFLISSFFFPVMSLVDKNVVDVSQISELLLSIIPTNILEAFLKGKVLQVTIMAFAVGIGIIKIGSRIENVKNFVAELNFLMFKIVEMVFSTIPLVIFLCVAKALLTSSLADFLKVWKIIVAGLIVYVIIILLMMIRLYLKTKVSIPDFLKKISPAAIISLTTGSSVASLPKTLEISKENLRVEEKFCNFWVPLSLVLFSPSKLIQLSMAGFYVMSITGEDFSAFEAVITAFLAIQLSFASPNAAGGIVASFTLLLTQLGLPLEHVGTLMIADVITGNLFTGLNVLVRQCELMTVAHKMNFIKT
ncbi:MAG: cation:dicarboxylase symporter family transporter [Selenomonadaceae bacterium]|nr:cation:dicarboxylase symporter family transporter [Selenomonadaceae bacterium]